MTRTAAWVLWPAGLLLTLAYTLGGVVPPPLHLVLDTLLVAATLLFLRSSGGSADRVAAALVLAGVGIFVLVVLTGAPTARRPELMLLNATVLLTIPFMSTVLPYALGVSLLRGRSSRNDHTRPPERKRMGASTSVPQSSR